MLGQSVEANWCFYSPNIRSGILRREHQSLRQSPRPIRLAHYPTESDHKIGLAGLENNKSSVGRNDRMGGEENDLRQLVAGNNADAGLALYDDAYVDVPQTGGNQTGNNVDQSPIIREFLVDD